MKAVLQRVLALLCASLLLLGPISAKAQSLLQLLQRMQQNNPSYAQARASNAASLALAEQSKSGVFPSLGLNITRTYSRTLLDLQNSPGGAFNALPRQNYGVQNFQLNGSLPLFAPAKWAAYEQGSVVAELADIALAERERALLLELAQTYFNALSAQEDLILLETQEKAIQSQLHLAQRNFEIGSGNITDVRDAQAQYDITHAQTIAAENTLKIQTAALSALVGERSSPQPLRSPFTPIPIQPSDVEAWIAKALQNNTAVQTAQKNIIQAELELDKADAGKLPTLDLDVSLARRNTFDGTLQTSASGLANRGANNKNHTASIGLSLTIPIFSGFLQQNKVAQALALLEQAKANLAVIKRDVGQSVTSLYYAAINDIAQVKALASAVASTDSALQANQLGYEVGVRINIDVLNAQTQFFQARNKLTKARYNSILSYLKLLQVSGELSQADIELVDAFLQK